jgi:hypothetical protein
MINDLELDYDLDDIPYDETGEELTNRWGEPLSQRSWLPREDQDSY